MSSLATCKWKCPKQGRYRTKHMQLCGRTLVCLARSDPSGEGIKRGKGEKGTEGEQRERKGKGREFHCLGIWRDWGRKLHHQRSV